MSTRALIAVPTSEGSWKGRFHHLDGYPSSLGDTLFYLYHYRSACNLAAMVRELTQEHGTWSSINDADWTQPIGYTDHRKRVCETCGAPVTDHYRQYYKDRELPDPALAAEYNPILVLGHSPNLSSDPVGPQCMCHGDVAIGIGAADWFTPEDSGGAIWAYVLTPQGLDIYYLFGEWEKVAFVSWGIQTPNWGAIEGSVGGTL